MVELHSTAKPFESSSMSNDFTKPTACPKCDATDIRFIIRGMPSEHGLAMIQRGEAVDGGWYVAEGLPLWRCMACGCEFTDETDPAVVELRATERAEFEKLRRR